MVKKIVNCLLVSCCFVGSLSLGVRADELSLSAVPNSPETTENVEEINQAIAQLRSVQQLRDVDPTNWSYEALKNLVERYGCIVGYADRTYRGERALTRYEFAAGLNACLESLERKLIQAAQTQAATTKPVVQENSTGFSVSEALERGFFNSTGQFWDQMSISGQMNQIFGWRTFPGSFEDNQITSDAKTISIIMSDVLDQQTPGPRVRTRDLSNPYDTSLLENPNYLSPAQVNPSFNNFEIIIQP